MELAQFGKFRCLPEGQQSLLVKGGCGFHKNPGTALTLGDTKGTLDSIRKLKGQWHDWKVRVLGILASDWRSEGLTPVCPELRLEGWQTGVSHSTATKYPSLAGRSR